MPSIPTPAHLNSSRTEGAGLNPLVSIVIPVYNVEKYLRECLDSVVNQTIRDLQIICINDGSTDNSLAILQEYAKKDCRIQIINQKNAGQSVARNAALPFVKGKYICFVDSDDWIDLQLCEKVYDKAERTGADMTLLFFNTLKKTPLQNITNYLTEHSYFIPDVKDKNCLEMSRYTSVWATLWKTSFLFDNCLTFAEGLTREDDIFYWQAWIKNPKLALVTERLYFYRPNPVSTMHSLDRRTLDIIEVFRVIKDCLVSENKFNGEWKRLFLRHKLRVLHHTYRHVKEHSLRTEFFEGIKKSIGNDEWEYLHSRNELRWNVNLFYRCIIGCSLLGQLWNRMKKQISRACSYYP